MTWIPGSVYRRGIISAGVCALKWFFSSFLFLLYIMCPMCVCFIIVMSNGIGRNVSKWWFVQTHTELYIHTLMDGWIRCCILRRNMKKGEVSTLFYINFVYVACIYRYLWISREPIYLYKFFALLFYAKIMRLRDVFVQYGEMIQGRVMMKKCLKNFFEKVSFLLSTQTFLCRYWPSLLLHISLWQNTLFCAIFGVLNFLFGFLLPFFKQTDTYLHCRCTYSTSSE